MLNNMGLPSLFILLSGGVALPPTALLAAIIAHGFAVSAGL